MRVIGNMNKIFAIIAISTVFACAKALPTDMPKVEGPESVTYTVTCFSGGTKIYEGTASYVSWDDVGYIIKETDSQKTVRLSGNCVISD